MDNEKYIEKWLDNSLSEEEKRVFEKTSDYQSLEKLNKALLKFKAPDYDVQSELSRLKSSKLSKGKEVKISWIQPLLRVAAVIALAVVGYYFFVHNATTHIESTVAQKVELFLPDNSEVILNANSSLSYVENQWEKQREVKLKGEAFFKVAKGARFDVETPSGIVSVLGTQFNVKARDNYFEVICYEGRVAVETEEKRVELAPNHMFRIINNTHSNDSIFIEITPSWVTNESSFTSVPFQYVINELERQYNVTITTNNVDLSKLFTGRFTHDDIDLALRSISLPLKLNYELEEGHHIILTPEVE